MTITANNLITSAYYLSSIVSKQLQNITPDQLTEGLSLLNDLLSEMSITPSLIPNYTEIDVTAVPGQEVYFLENVVEVTSVTFNIGTVRYAMREIQRDKYHGSPRVDDLQSLPFTWFADKVTGGMNLYLYFLPNDAYPIKVWGKVMPAQITDIYAPLDFDRFFLKYLKYKLAEDVCAEYGISVPPQTKQRLLDLNYELTEQAGMDLSADIMPAFGNGGYFNYADVNLGKGWRP